MTDRFSGKAWVYGDNVDTDVIIPARYLSTSDPAELAPHCLEDLDADFMKRMVRGDILVAGSNFGCGSSREHAPLAIKGAGVSCVIAASFARIFFRNALNIGLPILECPEAVLGIRSGQRIEVDLTTQHLSAYDGPTLVLSTSISSGIPKWRTLVGVFQVQEKVDDAYNKLAHIRMPNWLSI